MEETNIRWHQRLSNYNKALTQLTKFVAKQNLSDMEEQGLIQSFEYSFELAGNCMKDLFEYEGEVNIPGSRDAIRLAFKRGLISDGDGWMEMIKDRIKTVHSYDEAIAKRVVAAIINNYYSLFISLQYELISIKEKQNL